MGRRSGQRISIVLSLALLVASLDGGTTSPWIAVDEVSQPTVAKADVDVEADGDAETEAAPESDDATDGSAGDAPTDQPALHDAEAAANANPSVDSGTGQGDEGPADEAPSTETPGKDDLPSIPTPGNEDSVEETPSADAEDILPEPQPTRPGSVGPRAVDNFCTPGKYYILDSRGSLQASIHEGSYNSSTKQITGSTPRSPNIPVDLIGNKSSDVGINSLGVTPTGVFYFTTQSNTTLSNRPYDIYRYEVNSIDIAKRGTLTKVVNKGSNPSTEAFVAGAVDPISGDFYFGHYKNTYGFLGAGRVVLHLYRHEAGSSTAKKIGVFQTPDRLNIGSNAGNGDFAFNDKGDLIFITSPTAGTGTGAMTGTISADQIRRATESAGAPTYDIPRGSVRNKLAFNGGDAYNGIVFTEQGDLIVEQGRTNRMKNSITFANLTTGSTLLTNATQPTDLASCNPAPTLEVTKNIVERVKPADQFELIAEWHETETGATEPVSTNVTEGTTPGVQAEAIGPTPVSSNTWYTISEKAAGGANLSDYASSLDCTIGGAQVPTKRVTDYSYRVFYPQVESGKASSLKCEITNAPLKPNLTVAKTATPESGTAVKQGQDVTYTVTLDNATGTAPAPVTYTDHLADVLDDAIWVSGPKIQGNGVQATARDFNATSGAISGKKPRLDFTGSVPAKSKVTVSYSVRVLPDAEQRTDTDGGTDYVLRNAVVKTGDTPPATCEASSKLCTEHSVIAWTVEKTSDPASGSRVAHGTLITYTLTVKRLGVGMDIPGIVVTDDLTDVMRSADWVAALASQGITEKLQPPVFNKATGTWTAKTNAFTLPKATSSAQLSFRVRAGEPAKADGWNPHPDSEGTVPSGTTLTNTVTATSPVPPAACKTGDTDSMNAQQCSVTHTYADLSFQVRKLSSQIDAGTGTPIELLGHEFQIRQDDNGTMSDVAPPNACTPSNTQGPSAGDAAGCWRFYPIGSGSQEGTWQARQLPSGTYWLLETKAPSHQRVGNEAPQPIDGVQLLAEPIKFRVGPDASDNELDVLIPTGLGDQTAGRCESGGGTLAVTACVDEAGKTMNVVDPRLWSLPMTGGMGFLWSGIGALGVLAVVLAGTYILTGRSPRSGAHAADSRPSAHDDPDQTS